MRKYKGKSSETEKTDSHTDLKSIDSKDDNSLESRYQNGNKYVLEEIERTWIFLRLRWIEFTEWFY